MKFSVSYFQIHSSLGQSDLNWNNIIDDNKWQENVEKTIYANELLNQKEIDLGHQVKKIEMKTFLQNNEFGSPNIFLNNSQKELWNQVLDYFESKEDTHSVVIGNPGIGKSRSMSYFLRLLLQKKKIVVYESKKDVTAHIFIPQEDGNYKVWSCTNFSIYACAHLKNPDNYYLIDSNMPSDPKISMSHTLLCTSTNISQYHEFQKRGGTIIWLMPTWKKEESKCLQKEIEAGKNYLSDDEFEKRFTIFGGKIGYIFCSTHKFSYWLMCLYNSTSRITFDQLMIAFSNHIVDIRKSEDEGPSMVFSYGVPGTFGHYKRTSQNISVSTSEGIRQLLAVKFWKTIMQTLGPKNTNYIYSGNFRIENRRVFEMISSVYLEFPVNLKAYNKERSHDHDLNLIQAERIEFSGEWDQYLDYYSTLKENNSIRQILIPKARNQPFIDFMDQRNRGYQITIEKEYSINRENLQDIFEKLKISIDNPFYLYFVIPEFNKNEFKWYFEGEFRMDPRVQSIEKKSVEMLKEELKCNPSVANMKNNEKLVKLMLTEQNITSETNNDISKKIEECLRIYYVLIPEEDQKMEEFILGVHKNKYFDL
jgi:hypothetical protein